MKLKNIYHKFNLNNIKVSKRLIISFSILILFMLIVGTFGVLTIKSTQEGSIIQGYIENVISDVRVVNEHNIAYRFDRNDYRPDIIREKVGLAVEVLEELKPYVPDLLLNRYDSVYADIVSLTDFSEDYFKSSLRYDSLVTRGLELEEEMTVTFEQFSVSGLKKMKFKENLNQIHVELIRHLLHQGVYKDMEPLNKAYEQIVKQSQEYGRLGKLSNQTIELGQTINQFKEIHTHAGWVNWKIENVSFNAISSLDIISERFKSFLDSELRQNIIIIISTVIISFLFAVIIAFLIIRSINSGLKEVMVISEQIAKGDLSLNTLNNSCQRTDEFGRLKEQFSVMLQSLRNNVNSLLNMSNILENTGNVMFKSAQQISNNANGQAASVEEISATLDEIAMDINSNAENANKTKLLSKSSMQFVEKMDERNQLIIEKSMQIERESETVTGIAVQTNILALNAAVEAAIAGVSGRAFGVVAAKVKELADISKNASDQIIMLSKEGVEYSNEGGRIVKKVLPSLRQIDEKIDEVALATNEQRYKSEQIIKALHNLNELSQINATQSEELSASSEELKEHAVSLKKQVDFFTL